MAHLLLLGIGITQMVVGVIKPSIDAAVYSEAIQKNIAQTKEETENIKEQYSKLSQDIKKFDVELKNDIQNKLNTISKLHAEINEYQSQIQDTKKKIQMFGIIFIVTIFFSFIIKEFDLFNFLKKKSYNK